MTRIGRYEIVGELGRGAMGVVYQATDPAIGRSVAIKIIRILDIQDAVERQKLRDRLFREARSAGVLSHPNIVTIYDIDEVDGLAWIAMAHVKGPTLERILAASQPLQGPHILHILRQLATALDYAHSRGVVHRDIKPANIMTDDDGVLKITDFGIARINGAGATETRTVVGTPYYMSPEQVQGRPVDGASDQFSLAVVAYEMLTGERPFQGEHLSNILYKIVHEESLPPSRINATLSPAIDHVLRRALAKTPADRFANCSSFVATLEMACGESRGWRPIAAGGGPVISAMPPVAAPQVPGPISATGAPGQPPASRVGPVFLMLVLGIAGVVAWLGGLIGNSGITSVRDAVGDAFRNGDRVAAATTAHPAAVLQPEPEQDLPFRKPSPLPELAADVAVPAANPTADTASPGGFQEVWVSTDPPGAKAVLDDRLDQYCQTPCMLHSRSGVHHLTVSQAGYLLEYREVHVGSSALDVPVIALRQPGAALMVSSQPAGADIRIDGQLQAQQTPASIILKPGTYMVTVEKDGRSEVQRIDMLDSPVFLRIPLGP
jgi:serine/threonine-protein kinase